jgi:ATP-binding cassette, subfamily B, bacterial
MTRPDRPSLRRGPRLGVLSALSTSALLMRENRLRGVLGVGLVLTGGLSAPLLGVALAALVDAAAGRNLEYSIMAAAGVAFAAVLQLTAGHFASMVFGDLGERALLTLQARLIRSAQGTVSLARQEGHAYADTLSLLRQEVYSLPYVVLGLLQTTAVLIQMMLTIVLLGRLQPLLALLPIAGLAPYLAGRHANRRLEQARRENIEDYRRAQALLELAQRPGPMLEIRLAGLSDELRGRERELLSRVSRGLARAEAKGAATRALGQLVFAIAYGAALIDVVRGTVRGHGSPGDVVLAIVLARQIAAGITQVLSLATDIDKAGRISDRLRWLLAPADGRTAAGSRSTLPAPAGLKQGIELRDVAFRFPGSSSDALWGINLTLPAGRVVALVGENGAGKSTLVKLLCGLYQPSSGLISVDGIALTDLDVADWWVRLSAAFQDYVRFEFPLQQTVGIGDLPRADDVDAVGSALDAADAARFVGGLRYGLATRIGASFLDGCELSGGQWQLLAISRGMMRDRPVLLMLDEPTAALDAATEHELFERQLKRARRVAEANGAIALFVSHRYSTVSMADYIVVLDHGTIAERGTHAELLSAGGHYAELYEMQARNYRESRTA